MEIDLHIHTSRYSGCSNIDAVKLLRKSKEVGLDGIALTEHGICWSAEYIEEIRTKSGMTDLVILPGQEVACYTKFGHFQGEFLVFGPTRSLGSSRSLEQILAVVHGEGGVVIAAHPYRKLPHEAGFYGAGNGVYGLDIDGLEVEHPSYDDESRLLAQKAVRAKKIAGIGCSDAHDLRSVGICRTVFSKPVRDIGTLCEEIKACRVEARRLDS
ncbi:MAG: PHP domain-containing protein [Deltaproteobacteria bacterium]|nr:PHP domain-containing protein [Deltaproteobacteria bacterium]